jgi:hypothetical protein
VRRTNDNEDNTRKFPLPRLSGDGSCDLKSGISFLNDQDGETCSLKIMSLS